VKPAANVEYFLESLFASQRNNRGRRPSLFDIAFLTRRYRHEYRMTATPVLVQAIVFPLVVAIGSVLGKYRKYADAPEHLTPSTRGR
jgi:hypothetical protein